MPQLIYNKEADAAYIYLREGVPVARTKNLDGARLIDYAADDVPTGVELLDVREGVNLDGLPEHDVIEQLLLEHHIPVFA